MNNLSSDSKESVRLIKLDKSNVFTKVAKKLNVKMIEANYTKFSNGEIYVNIGRSVRNKQIYLFQTFKENINEEIMTTLITIDSLKRASADSINLVIPYYPYSRQDRKTKPREPITSKLIADILQRAGVSRIITMDLHAPQIQGFFDIPIDNYQGLPLIYNYFMKNFTREELEKNFVVVSPDHGGVNRARQLAESLQCPIAIIDKRRPKANHSVVVNVIGDVKDKNLIIIDDIIDTGGSLCNAAKTLKANGAKDIYGACTHPVLSGNAYENINNSVFKKIVVLNTMAIDETKTEKIDVIDISNLIKLAIENTHNGKSVSNLFRTIKQN